MLPRGKIYDLIRQRGCPDVDDLGVSCVGKPQWQSRLSGEDHSGLELATFWAAAQAASPRNSDGEDLAGDLESRSDTLAEPRSSSAAAGKMHTGHRRLTASTPFYNLRTCTCHRIYFTHCIVYVSVNTAVTMAKVYLHVCHANETARL